MVQRPGDERVSVVSVTLAPDRVERLVTRSTAHGIQVLDFDNHELPRLTADVLLPGWDDSLCDSEVYFMKEGRKALAVSELRRVYRKHCGETRPEKRKQARRVADEEDEDEDDEEAQPVADAPGAEDEDEDVDEDEDGDEEDDEENGLVAVCDDAVDNVVVEDDDKEDGSMMRA